jgi:hypothetical protein
VFAAKVYRCVQFGLIFKQSLQYDLGDGTLAGWHPDDGDGTLTTGWHPGHVGDR